MDSTLTLVNPSRPPCFTSTTRVSSIPPSHTLTVKSRIVSPQSGTTASKIQVARGEEVVIVIEENEVFADTVTIRGTKMKIKKWLQEQRVGDINAKLIDTRYGRFLWRIHPQYRLSLSREDDPHLVSSNPLAYVDTQAPGPGLTLVISSEATPFTEEILASFVIQELALERQEKICGVAYGVAYNSSIPF
ncbi:hypothetical protein BDZ89DRAFT_1140740 [Hymenopellis radicata]|nr:hypothetical protein BDZ89DRAFT_1140740 [Hymenopellis radicata]